MKTKLFLIAIFIFSTLLTAEVLKKEIRVEGNCGSCKKRIEKAAKVDGVKKASWDKKTKILTVTFDNAKISTDSLQKIVAEVGHDTPLYKAKDEVYSELPGCCLYREVESH